MAFRDVTDEVKGFRDVTPKGFREVTLTSPADEGEPPYQFSMQSDQPAKKSGFFERIGDRAANAYNKAAPDDFGLNPEQKAGFNKFGPVGMAAGTLADSALGWMELGDAGLRGAIGGAMGAMDASPRFERDINQLVDIGGMVAGSTAPAAAAPRAARAFREIKDAAETVKELPKSPEALPLDQIMARGQPSPLTPQATKALTPPPPKTDFAGNINLNNIQGTEDISRVLSTVADQNAGFMPARRGVQSHEATKALADDMGMTVETLTKRRLGQAFNAEQAVAARSLLATSGDNLMDLSRQIVASKEKGVTDNNLLFDFQKAYTRHVAIQEQVAGLTAEAGRALNAFKIPAQSEKLKLDAMKNIMRGHGEGEGLEGLAEKMAAFDDPAALNKFARQSFDPKFSDKILEVWINGLLSGPETHVVNFRSNALFQALQVPERALAATIGKLRGSVDPISYREVWANATGMLNALPDAARASWKALKTEEPSDVIDKLDQRRYRAIGGLPGEAVRLPGRALLAGDEFFKAIAHRSMIDGLAVRQGLKEGLSGDALKARITELSSSPTDGMLEEATKYKRYVTFTSELGPKGRKILNVVNETPVLRVVFPFIRTPTNLIKRAAERTPLGLVMKEVRDDLRKGGPDADLAAARLLGGSAAAAWLIAKGAEGGVTGSGPANYARRQEMQNAGWRPNSIKIGDNYVSYSRYDPFTTILGLAADIGENWGQLSDDDRKNAAELLTGALVNNITDKTWTRGLQEIANALSDPDRYGEKYVQNLVGTLVPTGVAQFNRDQDPLVYDTRPESVDGEWYEAQLEAILNSVKVRSGQTEGMAVQRDVWGEPIQRDRKIPSSATVLEPTRMATITDDPVRLEANRLKLGITRPQRRLGGMELTPTEYSRYVELSGKAAHDILGRWVAAPQWRDLPEAMKKEIFRDEVETARKEARIQLLSEFPRLQDIYNPLKDELINELTGTAAR